MGLTMHLMFSNNNKLNKIRGDFIFFRSGDKIYVLLFFYYYLAVNEN